MSAVRSPKGEKQKNEINLHLLQKMQAKPVLRTITPKLRKQRKKSKDCNASCSFTQDEMAKSLPVISNFLNNRVQTEEDVQQAKDVCGTQMYANVKPSTRSRMKSVARVNRVIDLTLGSQRSSQIANTSPSPVKKRSTSKQPQTRSSSAVKMPKINLGKALNPDLNL